MENFYSIKINRNCATSKYIMHCDDCWYETTTTPQFIYTLQQAKKIAKQMSNHYVYNMDIIDKEQNIVENINLLPKAEISVNSPIANIQMNAVENTIKNETKRKGNSMSSILKCFANIQ